MVLWKPSIWSGVEDLEGSLMGFPLAVSEAYVCRWGWVMHAKHYPQNRTQPGTYYAGCWQHNYTTCWVPSKSLHSHGENQRVRKQTIITLLIGGKRNYTVGYFFEVSLKEWVTNSTGIENEEAFLQEELVWAKAWKCAGTCQWRTESSVTLMQESWRWGSGPD